MNTLKKYVILGVTFIMGMGSAFAQNAELTPIKEFSKDIKPEQVQKYRKDYRSKDFLINADNGTYGFLNIPEFYLTATVNKGAGQVAMLEEEPNEAIWNTKTDTKLGKMPLRDLVNLEEARMQGLLVIHDGKIVLEVYNGMRQLDKHSWFSASKQLLGMTVHILEEEGLIDLEKSVNYYIPEYDTEDWKKIKVKHLLHHVSGMDYVESNENFMNPDHPLNKAVKYSLSTRWEDAGESVFDLMKGVKSHIEPGVRYEYSSMNTQILGFIVERVTDKKYEEVVSDKIWAQVGMECDGQYGMSAHGEPLSAGLFTSRLRDFGRFAMLYTPSWNKVSDTKIVSDSYFEKAYDTEFAPALVNGWDGSKAPAFKEGQSHATYQWDIVFDDGDMYKAGRYGQGIYVSPETNTVVVFFSNVFMNKFYIPDFARQIVKQNYR
nr:serine hydrolase domain-containing protein [uncultured Carboxylicivirga sp.]